MHTFLDHGRCFGFPYYCHQLYYTNSYRSPVERCLGNNRFSLFNSEDRHSGGNGNGFSSLTPYRTAVGPEDYRSQGGRYGGVDFQGIERKARRTLLR